MRTLLIILLSILILPVFAQEVDSDIPENPFTTIIIAIIGSIVGSFVGGTILGNYISNKNEKSRRTEELKRVRDLIKNDFTTVKRLTRGMLKNQKKIYEHFTNGKSLSKKDEESLKNFNISYKPSLIFPFWETITNTGALLKLQPVEIKTIQSVHDKVLEAYSHQIQNHKDYTDSVMGEKDTDKVITKFINYNNLLYNTNLIILEMLDYMNEIDWFDFKSEVFVERKSPKKVVVDTPEIKQDWESLLKSYRSGKLMKGYLEELKFIKKEIEGHDKSSKNVNPENS